MTLFPNAAARVRAGFILAALLATCTALCAAVGFEAQAGAAELKVGTAKADITPKKSVPLFGQFEMRLSEGVRSPLTVNVCAIEAVENGQPVDSAILVSMDLLYGYKTFGARVREKVAAMRPEIQVDKIVTFGTHTHDAPSLEGGPEFPESDKTEGYQETLEDLSTRMAEAVATAWDARVPAEFSWGIEQIVLGQSRRACYFDGHAEMYGNPNKPEFSHYENPSDPDLGTLFFWDRQGKLLSVVVNAACPSQIVEHLNALCADYWHEVRNRLYQRFGDGVVVVACNAPAGDGAPHPQYRKLAVARMQDLRFGTEGSFEEKLMLEFARRIDQAVGDAYECAVQDKRTDPAFRHISKNLELPLRIVTDAEYKEAVDSLAEYEKQLKDNPGKTPAEIAFMGFGWHGYVKDRYEAQHAGTAKPYSTVIHVIRFGEIAMATDEFELFVDYSMRIKARSPAMATFVADISDGFGYYLPTAKAVKAGGYSAVIQCAPVSPEGGQILVEETLGLLKKAME